MADPPLTSQPHPLTHHKENANYSMLKLAWSPPCLANSIELSENEGIDMNKTNETFHCFCIYLGIAV